MLDANGIIHTGAGRNIDEAHKPAIVERKGVKIGFLQYTARVIQNQSIRRVSFVPVTRDGNNDVYLLDPSEGEGAKLTQWVKERSSTPPPMRIDGHEVVMFERLPVTSSR